MSEKQAVVPFEAGRAPRSRPVQRAIACPYCRIPLAIRADGSFSCGRCGEFPNYGRIPAPQS